MGGSAHKVLRTLEAWLQCVYHVFRNFRKPCSRAYPGLLSRKSVLHCIAASRQYGSWSHASVTALAIVKLLTASLRPMNAIVV